MSEAITSFQGYRRRYAVSQAHHLEQVARDLRVILDLLHYRPVVPVITYADGAYEEGHEMDVVSLVDACLSMANEIKRKLG